MPKLDERGREILDQTPVSIPFPVNRPEPIHMRLRRMILESLQGVKGDDVETLEDANDFEIPDDPSSFSSEYTEPDYVGPASPEVEKAPRNFSDEELAAARKAIDDLRASKENSNNSNQIETS